ncbi:MAG: transcription antitermination protein NusB, partial [Kutzneria sp.]|nr:transcription antitermination protein NusB [Kutzneria sp.]
MGARSKARRRAVDVLYEADLREVDPVALLAERVDSPDVAPVNEYTRALVRGVTDNRVRIDELISEHAEGWTLGRMPPVDRAVLRLGVYELLWEADLPDA